MVGPREREQVETVKHGVDCDMSEIRFHKKNGNSNTHTNDNLRLQTLSHFLIFNDYNYIMSQCIHIMKIVPKMYKTCSFLGIIEI